MRPGGAACATCRKKSRRCDRTRPVCKRCISKDLECGGYPEKFRFCGLASRGKWKNRDAPTLDDEPAPIATEQPQETAENGLVAAIQQQTPTNSQETQEDDCDAEDTTFDVISSLVSFLPTATGDANAVISPAYTSTSSPSPEIDKVLSSNDAEMLLAHYDRVICPHQIAQRTDACMENPYRLYVLPLAYEQTSVLYATLALSACHLGHLKSDPDFHESIAVNYRLKAISALGTTIKKGYSLNFDENERDGVFATIQLLLLHDICESGISEHGAHISGAVSVCSQIIVDPQLHASQERMVFFLGNLVWLDIVRAFARPERLCFNQEFREQLLTLGNLKFEAVNGCPRDLTLIMGGLLEAAKANISGTLGVKGYLEIIQRSIDDLYAWDSSHCFYPDDDPLWISVAESFRHACILRALRLLDVTEPADKPRIQDSVHSILDAVADIPAESPLIELMVLPLFMAGADCLSPHSRHYVMLRIDGIKARSEMSNTAPKELLLKVWESRSQQVFGDRSNIPWMQFTHTYDSAHQHDYLIL